jgi:hypothetical protein
MCTKHSSIVDIASYVDIDSFSYSEYKQIKGGLCEISHFKWRAVRKYYQCNCMLL